MEKQVLFCFFVCKLIFISLQVDLVGEEERDETPLPQQESAEEPMEVPQPEPSDLQESAKDVEANLTEPEADSGTDTVE